MNNDNIESLRKKVKKALKSDHMRYRHTLGVADTCACIAMCYGYDMEKSYIAGLLHDCAKCIPDEQKIRECQENNIEITDIEMKSPYLLHSKLGAFYAKTIYGIEDSDICSAIKYHTIGRPAMTMLEKIVFVADYIEPYRNKASNLDYIRKLTFSDIDEAVLKILTDTLDYLKNKNASIDSQTFDTYNYYKNLAQK